MQRRSLKVEGIDLRATLEPQATYPRDPTHRSNRAGLAKAFRTPDGPASLVLDWRVSGKVDAEAHGPGAAWLLDRLPAFVGLEDDPTAFDPSPNRPLEQLWRRHGRFRLCSGGVIWQELVLVLLGQRVTTQSAVESWARLCRLEGEAAPGFPDILLPPSPETIQDLDLAAFHRLGVERHRADVIRRAASRANRLEEAAAMDPPEAIARMTAIPGIGPWSATSVVTVSHGDPDTVILGDLKLPSLVNYAFSGDARRLPPEDGDRVMLEHLEPWRGQRQRVMRLLVVAGVTLPRRAAKRANPDIRHL